MTSDPRTSPDAATEPRPGETRLLERAPSDRFRSNSRLARGRGSDEVARSGSLRRALLYGAVAAIGTAVAWMIGRAAFNLELGLLVVAAVGGWAIGEATGYGGARTADRRIQLMAAVLGVLTWGLGTLLGEVAQRALIRESTRSLSARVLDDLPGGIASQLSLVDGVAVVLLVTIAWRSAR